MKNGVPLLIALVLGVLGFAAMKVVMSRQREQANALLQGPRETTRVVVARADLAAGIKIEPQHLDAREIPTEYCSSIHIEDTRRTWLLGKTISASLRKGEPILAPAVLIDSMGGGKEIEGQLRPPDSHAVAVDIGAAEGIGGLIKPGQKVDVIVTFEFDSEHKNSKEDARQGETWTYFLLQNRTVLAVDVHTKSRYEGDPKAVTSRIVTLAVTPDEALKLARVQARGHPLHMALRNAIDGRAIEAPPINADKFYPKGGSSSNR